MQNGNKTPSLIGTDVKIVGNVSTTGELQLDGTVEGDLRCGSVTMGDTGKVIGSVVADKVIVRGGVKGEIKARSVRLESSARVEGDIVHESLSVEAGAKLSGRMTHSANPLQNAEKPNATGAQAPAAVQKPNVAKAVS